MPFAMQQELGIVPMLRLTRPQDPSWFDEYRPEVIIPMITPLKAACPRLAEVRFGAQYRLPGEKAWTVRFCQTRNVDSAGATALGRAINRSPAHAIHIEHVSHSHIYLFECPPTEMEPIPYVPHPLPPSRPISVTQSARFDLDLDTVYQGQPIASSMFDPEQWLTAFRTTPLFAHLYRYIDFGQLELTLDAVTALVQRQIDAGYTERLAYISARYILPFDIDSFTSFAQIASKSLVSLRLAERYSDHLNVMAFNDLPLLIEAISSSLPNLDTLHIAMQGIDIAEDICWNMLSEKPIDFRRTGNLQSLRIYTASSHTDLFNTIRCLSTLLLDRPLFPLLHVGPDTGAVFKWDAEAQIKFLMYIRR
jgi:hypothetical protein